MLWFFFNLSSIYLLLYPSIFFHELGHALAGKLFKLKIFSLTVGDGRSLFQKNIIGTNVAFKSLPKRGSTVGLPDNFDYFKTRMWFFVLGGPLVHIFWLLSFYFILGSDRFLETIAPRSFFLGFAPLTVFLYINVLIFLGSLYPKTFTLPDRRQETDGYKLLTIPFRKSEELKKPLNIYFDAVKADAFYKEGNYAQAKPLYHELKDKLPNNIPVILQLGYIELLEGNRVESNTIYREGLSKIETEFADDPAYLPYLNMFYNNIAWVNIISENPDLIEQADNYSKKALASAPGSFLFQGTRGAVMIRNGEFEEGLSLLQKSYAQQTDNLAKSNEALFLSLGEAKKGNQSEALKWLETARHVHPENFLLAIMEKEIHEVNAGWQTVAGRAAIIETI